MVRQPAVALAGSMCFYSIPNFRETLSKVVSLILILRSLEANVCLSRTEERNTSSWKGFPSTSWTVSGESERPGWIVLPICRQWKWGALCHSLHHLCKFKCSKYDLLSFSCICFSNLRRLRYFEIILQESYPCMAPMWFTEADENSVVESVEKISKKQHNNPEKLVGIIASFINPLLHTDSIL